MTLERRSEAGTRCALLDSTMVLAITADVRKGRASGLTENDRGPDRVWSEVETGGTHGGKGSKGRASLSAKQ